jgi:pimeloyl-ACP methyl ester carboxylesterase
VKFPPPRVSPTITWPNPSPVTSGTALTQAQLNATANISGTFSYSPSSGTVLAAGPQTLSVTFIPTDTTDYATVTATAILQVNQATPTITWPALTPVMSGTTLSGNQLNTTASVSGTFTYAPSPGTILGSGIQALVANFTPADSANYTSATFTNTLIIQPSSPTNSVSSTLSANSGINPQDTYAIMDISAQSGGSVNLQSPAYNPQTQTTSSTFQANDIDRTFHMEVGYDTNGAPVLNVFPQVTNQDSATVNISPVSVIRYAGGQMTIADSNGNPISLAVPNSSISAGWPLSLSGLTSGTSILSSLVIPDIQAYALARNATLTISGTQAQLVGVSSTGPTIAWLYSQLSSGGWMLQALSMTSQDSTGTSARQTLFANLTYSDNASNDAARQANGFSYPRAVASTNGAMSATAPQGTPCGSSCGTYTLQNLGGAQNVVFQHGFASSGSTWSRMTGWLNQDFSFGNEVVTSLNALCSLSDQGQNLENIIQAAGGNQFILIGHSQGSLISRYAAQYFQGINTPSPTVQGVITVDTPHLGAALTVTGPAAIGYGIEQLAKKLSGNFGCITPLDNPGCYVADLIFVGADGFAQWGISTIGSLRDLTPGSAFLTQLNSGQENFAQAAVIGKTPQRWLAARVLDNIALGALVGPPDPESADGERNLAGVSRGCLRPRRFGLLYNRDSRVQLGILLHFR